MDKESKLKRASTLNKEEYDKIVRHRYSITNDSKHHPSLVMLDLKDTMLNKNEEEIIEENESIKSNKSSDMNNIDIHNSDKAVEENDHKNSKEMIIKNFKEGDKNNELRIGDYIMNISQMLGKGSFGSIFKGIHHKNNSKVAIKVESAHALVPQLNYEYKMIKYLHGYTSNTKKLDSQVVGIPQIHDFTTIGDFHFMIMEELGETIEKLSLSKTKKGKLSNKGILLVAEQMVSLIFIICSLVGYLIFIPKV